MNLKAFLLLAASRSVLVVHAEENHIRNLQQMKNEDCDVDGEISCKVIGNHIVNNYSILTDGTDCADLDVQLDLCKNIPVMMNYTFCNKELLPINELIVLPSLSFTDIYEANRTRLSFETIPADTCRTELRVLLIDTCIRNRVNADMKFEGWKEKRQNFGNYCHVYKHYFPKINKYTLPPTKSPLPAPQFRVDTLCFLESAKGNNDFTVSCDDVDIEYFMNSFRSETTEEEDSIDFERSVKYQFLIESLSGEVMTVDEIVVDIDSDRVLVPINANIEIGEGEQVIVGQLVKDVDFSNYSDEDFEIASTITVTGLKSGSTTVDTAQDTFEVPTIEFRWRLNNLNCFIKGTNQTCVDYLAALPTLDNTDLCEVRVEYSYEVENIGEACERITDVTSIVDEKSVTYDSFGWNFCPQDVETLVDSRKDNLCAFAGREIEFVAALNGEIGSPTAAFTAFPEPSGFPILSLIDLTCEIHNSDPTMSCEDYIKLQKQENLNCISNIVYRAEIKNIGDACMEVDKLVLDVGSRTFHFGTKNWDDEKRNFCPNDRLFMQRKDLGANLCDFAGQEIDSLVTIKGPNNAYEFSDSGSIVFPIPNSVTQAPAPTPAPVLATKPTSLCSSKPNSITIKLNRDTCTNSSNSQGIKRSRKLRRLGKNYPKYNCKCQECLDYNSMNIGSCATPVVTFSTKNSNGITVQILKEQIDFNKNYDFTPSEMPDCLQIEIHDESGKHKRKVQTVGFDVCSTGATLKVGDTFGAIEIVQIN